MPRSSNTRVRMSSSTERTAGSSSGGDGSASDASDPADQSSGSDVVTGQSIRLATRETYKKKGAQIVKVFDPRSDRLVIRVEDFGLDDFPEIGISKNKK